MFDLLHRRDRGQALVEFALAFPIFVLLVMATFEAGLAVVTFTSIQNSAREGARYAVTAPDDTNGVTAAARQAVFTLGGNTPNVTEAFPSKSDASGSPVAVTVTYQYHPLLGLIPPIQMTARSQMIIE